MKELNSMTFFKSFYDAIKNLNNEQQLEMYNAIFDFQFNGNEPQFNDAILNSIWLLILPNIEASNRRRLAGVRGGEIKKSKQSVRLKQSCKQNSQCLNNVVSKMLNAYTNVVSDKDKDKEVEKEKEIEIDADAEKEKSLATATAKNKVFDFYLNNINSLPTMHEIDQLKEYQKEMSDDLICFAIEKAVENKSCSLAYIKGILNSWRSKGITTLEEAKDEKRLLQNEADIEHEQMWDRLAEKYKDWKG